MRKITVGFSRTRLRFEFSVGTRDKGYIVSVPPHAEWEGTFVFGVEE